GERSSATLSEGRDEARGARPFIYLRMNFSDGCRCSAESALRGRGQRPRLQPITHHRSIFPYGLGRGCGVGRTLAGGAGLGVGVGRGVGVVVGVGVGLGVGVAVAVAVGVAVAVAVGVAVGVVEVVGWRLGAGELAA